MQEERQDIEELLSKGNSIQIKPQGYSMYPVLIPGRDEVIIEPVNISNLKRGDVILYRREGESVGGILVLHRIWKRTTNGFYMVGDNQTDIEGPLHVEQVKGIMVGIVRAGKYISVKSIFYRGTTGIWLLLRPMRPVISKTVANMKKIIKGFCK